MGEDSTRDGRGPATGKTQGRARRWLSCAMLAGAMTLSVLGGRSAEAQGLTPGGPIDFGSQPVGGTQTLLTLTFSATVPTTITSVNALTLGVANADFTIVSQTCSGAQAPPESCNVAIGFLPQAPGLRRGVLTLVDGSGSVVNEVFLHGIGLGAQVSQSPVPATVESALNGMSLAGFQVSALALDGEGTLYFNDVLYGRILKRTPAGAVTQFASLATTVNSSMAMDGAGTLYVTSGSSVYRVTSSGAVSVLPTGSIALVAPRGVAVDGTGSVYIADNAQNEIVRVATDGSSSVLAITGLSTPLSGPSGLSIDAANLLHIADTGNNRVVEAGIYTLVASPVAAVAVSAPLGVGVDASASSVIADTGNARIMVLSGSGSYALGVTDVAFSNPVAVIVQDNGDLVVADTVLGLVTVARSGVAQVVFRTATPIGQADTTDNPQRYSLQNSGNVDLRFAAPGSGSNPAMDDLAFSTDAVSGCPLLTSTSVLSDSTLLAPGAMCTYAADFTPTVAGRNTGHGVSTLTAAVGTPATLSPTVLLTGTGTSEVQKFTVTATPTEVQPGSVVSYTVTATTSSGAVVANYTGTVTMTASGTSGVFQGGASSYTFTSSDHGTHTFMAPAGVIFQTPGRFHLTASDGTSSGTSNDVVVEYADSFAIVAAPTSLVVGQAAGYGVTAMFQGAVAANYVGTVNFSATDAEAKFLGASSYVFTAADAGTHTFGAAAGVQFNTPGTFTIGAADSMASGTSNPITVGQVMTGDSVDGFVLTATPAATTIGTPVSYTVTAMLHGAVATGYTGMVAFSSTDATASFLSGTSYTFTVGDNGSRTFTAPASGVSFDRVGTFTVTATNGTVSGTSNDVVVSVESTATAFVLTATPTSTGVGIPVGFTISAVNSSGAVAARYTGTVRFSSSDAAAVLLGGTSYTFAGGDAGTHTFAAATGAQFHTVGSQTVSATDGSISGTSNFVTVVAADSFAIVATPSSTTVGSPVSFTVTAMLNGAVATGYVGTVTLASTDGLAKFLGGTTYTFAAGDAGTHTFSGTSAIAFESAGVFTISATSGTLSGMSNDVTVGAASGFAISAMPANTTVGAAVSFTVSATSGAAVNKGYAGTVTFSSTDATAKFLAGTTYTFTAADEGTHTFTAPAGVAFHQGGVFTVSATDGTLDGTSNTVTVLAATGFAVMAKPSATYVGSPVSYTVTATNGSTVIPDYTGTVTFSSTDATAKFSATSYTFTAADAGTHTFASGVTFNAAGTFTISATSGGLTGTSNSVAVTSVSGIVLTSSVNPVLAGGVVTLTATLPVVNGVAATGTVTFLDGSSTLGEGSIDASGVATLANVSFPLLGAHSLTAVYGGDAKFAPSTSAALAELVEDFTLGIAAGGTTSLSALAGHTATYSLLSTPLGGPTFAAPVKFTATGLPKGAEIGFSPASLATGTAATTVEFAVTPELRIGALRERGTDGMRLAQWSLMVLLLGTFGSRRKRLARMLLALALLPLSAMTGCLSSASDGYYGAAPGTYAVTVTATSGSLTHTQQLTLTVQ